MSFVSSQSEDAEFQLIGLWSRYSSWTARVEVVLQHFQIPYRRTFFNLFTPTGPAIMKKLSPNGFVPVLVPAGDESNRIHDSLAICEYLAESYPSLPLWPKDRTLRSLARSAAAEMHSGFGEIRGTYSANFLGKYSGDIPITEQGKKEIERILQLWGQARGKTVQRLSQLGQEDGGFLFGEFGIVDAFFWPILWRFRSYNLPLDTASPEALQWMRKMWNDPVLKGVGKDYYRQAEKPETHMEKYENIFEDRPGVTYELFDKDWEFSVPE